MTGDEKDPSEQSNIETVFYPVQPGQSPPVIEGFVFYYNGKPVPAIKPLEIPNGVSAWLIWYREFGNYEWILTAAQSGGDRYLYSYIPYDIFVPGNTYQFIIAWYDSTNQKILSDISNVATIALPSADISYLLPPKKLNAYFYGEYQGTYLNALYVQRGDMRAKYITVEGKRSSRGTWQTLWDFVFADHDVTDETTAYYVYPSFGEETPVPGETFEYRMKNKADGLSESVYSDVFSITVPSILPKLASPAVTLTQNGHSVILGLSEVEDSTGYKIERRSTNDSTWVVIQSLLSPSIRSYTDSSTSYGNTYFYRVTAVGDGNTYQNSDPTEKSINVTQYVVLPAPVIDSVTESGISVIVALSNINTANSSNVWIEMSENGGEWKRVADGIPSSTAASTSTTTIPGEKILEGGTLQFRAIAMPAAQAVDPSPYSEISSITIAEREWLLRWNGSSWDDPSGLTGGWVNQTVTWSDETEVSNITETTPEPGVKRLQGQGWYRTVNPIIENQGNLLTKYSRICMIGSLVKQADGTSNHAWFGVAFTYPFMGGKNFDTGNGSYVFAGSESGRAAAGTRVDPYFSPRASSSYTGKQGPYLFFRLHSGYADVKGIFAIKR